jgi:AAA15 family ATPase/GTPase
LHFNKFHIKNFKSFRDIKIEFNPQLNLFTGVNNSGKTSILEAIALWSECFDKLITRTEKNDNKLNIQKGEYKLGYSSSYLNPKIYFDYRYIQSIRTTSYKDIFYNLDVKNKIELTMNVMSDKDSIDIGFIIENSRGSNYKIYLFNYMTFDYQLFNRFFDKFPNPMTTVFSSPIANINPIEEFKTQPQIKDKLQQRDSVSVLRNRLNRLDEDDYYKFVSSLSHILSDKKDDITFDTKSNIKNDVCINYDITLHSKDIAKNLSLVGSGTLQIIEILLSLYENRKDLNIILFDDPDSHIHRDIQKRLMRVLTSFSSNIQIFISTHNESLIRSAKPQHIFHLEKVSKKLYRPIVYDEQIYTNSGLIPSKHLKVLQDLGNESALDLINALEADKLILVEGKYDPKYIQYILDISSDTKSHNIAYWSFEGIDNVFKHIFSYKDMFSKIKNEKTLWEKSVLIIDRDYLTDFQAKNLKEQLKKKLEIPIIIWDFYTIETVLIRNKNILSKIIFNYIDRSDIKKEEIINDINSEIERIAKNKLEVFDGELKNKILKWKNDKEKIFTKSDVSNIFPKDKAYPDMLEFHKNKLLNNEIDSLATKNDIEEIIKNVICKYKPDDKSINYFELILKNINKHNAWFDEWNEMIAIIET